MSTNHFNLERMPLDKTGVQWNGNQKMPYACWSITAQVSCPFATQGCARDCYVMKSYRRFPQVLESHRLNLKRTHAVNFAAWMSDNLARRQRTVETFRIHVAGDFYSEHYFLDWVSIAALNPLTRFFAFTKCYGLFKFMRPENFILIASKFYDETRDLPEGAPVFETVKRGETGAGYRCAGSCETCGMCAYAEPGLRVWTAVH